MEKLFILVVVTVFSLSFLTAQGAVLHKGMGDVPCLESNKIHIGDSVVWNNYFDRDYQVTSVDMYDHIDGNFDSGLLSPGKQFVHTFDQTGDYLYFCVIPHSGHGLIKVVEKNLPAETDPVNFEISNTSILSSKSADGSLVVNLVSDSPGVGKFLPIRVSFAGKYGEPLADVNFEINALQDGKSVAIDYDGNQPDGKIDYNVGPLGSSASMIIQIKLIGLGNPNEIKYLNIQKGEIINLQVTGASPARSPPPDPKPSPVDKIKETTFPPWFRNVLNWYDQKLITESDVVNSFNFLIKIGIIKN